jgi:adenylylsulfate kinase
MMMLQMTGLPGAGKSTLALLLKEALEAEGIACVIIDGDVYRKTLCRDLGFSAADRKENIRRLAKEADKFCKQGIVAIIAAINPFEAIRKELKDQYLAGIIWVHCSLGELIKRDPKGLYQRALLSDDHPDKINNLTGINDPFETPQNPDIIIDTGVNDKAACTRQLLEFTLTRLPNFS